MLQYLRPPLSIIIYLLAKAKERKNFIILKKKTDITTFLRMFVKEFLLKGEKQIMNTSVSG